MIEEQESHQGSDENSALSSYYEIIDCNPSISGDTWNLKLAESER